MRLPGSFMIPLRSGRLPTEGRIGSRYAMSAQANTPLQPPSGAKIAVG
jgi:hypothetical protein